MTNQTELTAERVERAIDHLESMSHCGYGPMRDTCATALAALRAEQESELPASSTPTNAQRIRGMSDEELQKFLRKFESGDIDYAKTFCDLCCKDAALERRSVDCDGCLLWWLKNDAKQPQGLDCWTKQPAETEGTE